MSPERQKSRYDELHDMYHTIATTKSGTRYERLAAFVFKALNDNGIVIHDIKLLGDSDVKHQIDVRITRRPGEEASHLIIECKDYDVSGDSVGLDVVRSFWGVIDDVHPDEAWIVTCNDFTSEARKYAARKGIKLAILREFREEDWEQRIKEIHTKIIARYLSDISISTVMFDEEDVRSLDAALSTLGMNRRTMISPGSEVWLNRPLGRIRFYDLVSREINYYPRNTLGAAHLTLDLEDTTIEIGDHPSLPIRGLEMNFSIQETEFTDVITVVDKVARLLLQSTDHDLIVWEDDLRALDIDADTGEVRQQS